MEIRVIGRGALAGLIAGILGFLFARIFAEPTIDKAIDYEAGRGEVLAALNTAAGRAVEPDGPEIFSRSIQSGVGVATGIIAFCVAMGALVAVAYLVLHGRFNVRPKVLGWTIAGFGFLGIYLLPFVKYPANPPAIGHDFTIETRGALYLGLVWGSLTLLALAVFVARKLSGKLGWARAVAITVVGFFVIYGGVLAALPSLGDLAANVEHSDEIGFARAATETPQPITNTLTHPVTYDGAVYAPGQLVYPGFDADLLWKFRWYSLINQILVWTVIGLVFGALLDRYFGGAKKTEPAAQGVPVA
ncbi:CbtA family protein [Mycobacterium sp. CBMA293]|uniref:CbtA family protein n=1 Tax=unclassified Mycolicibacterium TaxID=2636767 RepID=UPI00132198B0|nr:MULTISPECIES: CbtA family protein [unclassified Mycolicibacterium]MUL46141.1 CbtA family protein [Mycolicibacterium sp. CBMA 360]MUL94168.1 CbtA family protein [Mycolicibacterium sp. CBMA 230]MUM32574.1 CbtA family protein [Mycolicibacterium sp. CBMA 361]MUL58810.1 CbtA family protein [Mycolicibacterium sp. CBMA 335]MUL69204.1 CbtA family protein [Mycolicibacterium sp. CBMA 311]